MFFPFFLSTAGFYAPPLAMDSGKSLALQLCDFLFGKTGNLPYFLA